jgi:hypothetical protein
MKGLLLRTLMVAALASLIAGMADAQDEMRIEQVQFPAGSTGTTIEGRITGRESVLYKLGAEAGQTMSIALTSNNTATYFNVYEPGSGPGDQALATGDSPGPLVPEVNRFSGPLPLSGEYTVSVYLFRSAARRDETSDYTLDITITGETGDIVQGDFADGLQGGPDFWAVQTDGGMLNMRESPSSGAAIVTRLINGTPLRNLGCRMAEARRWCRVATLSDPGFEGWVAGSFLVEGSGQGAATQLPDLIPVPNTDGDATVAGTNYNATGLIDCVRNADAAAQSCAFGVIRQGGGNGAVTIEWPEGGGRTIFFEAGTPVSYDQSQADQGREMTVTRDGDNSIVFVGQERFVIPDAVIFGG